MLAQNVACGIEPTIRARRGEARKDFLNHAREEWAALVDQTFSGLDGSGRRAKLFSGIIRAVQRKPENVANFPGCASDH